MILGSQNHKSTSKDIHNFASLTKYYSNSRSKPYNNTILKCNVLDASNHIFNNRSVSQPTNHVISDSGSGKIKHLNKNKRIRYSSRIKSNDTLIEGYDHGLINGNGLTDGNGLTINLLSIGNPKYTQIYRRNKLSQLNARNKRRKYLKVMAAVFFTLLPLSIYFIEFEQNNQKIQIDGEFDDWAANDITRYSDTDTEPVQNPYTNLIDCRVQYQNNILDFYVQTELDLFGGKNPSSPAMKSNKIYKLDIFIDNDLSSMTGFQIRGIGADERIELQGQNGIVNRAFSYYFDPVKNNLDWNGWVKYSNVDVAKEKLRLEGRHFLVHSKNTIMTQSHHEMGEEIEVDNYSPNNIFWRGALDTPKIGIIMQLMDNEGNCDFTQPILTGSEPHHCLKITDLSPDYILPSDNQVPLLALELISPGKQTNTNQYAALRLSTISWDCQISGSYSLMELQEFGKLELFVDDNHNHKLDLPDYQISDCDIKISADSSLVIDFLPPLSTLKGGYNHYLLTIKPNHSLNLGPKTTKLLRMNLYPSNVISSSNIIVNIPKTSDNKLIVYLGDLPPRITMDGIFADWQKFGELKHDLDIPILSNKYQDLDINKIAIDIEPGSEIFSCYLNVHGNLLDGTTIPPIFYSGVLSTSKHSNILIKDTSEEKPDPLNNSNIIQQLPEELLGTDKISIFIDTDQDHNTGYDPTWLLLGAEYLIQITGREGIIQNKELLKFNVNSDDIWDWEKIADIPAYKDIKQLETQINWVEFGQEPVDALDIVFYISDWTGEIADSTAIESIPDYDDYINETSKVFGADSGLLIDFDILKDINDTYTTNEIEKSVSSSSTSRTRGEYKINVTDNLGSATDKPNQRKVVRDSDGHWYVFWESDNRVMAKRSVDTAGTDWSAQAVNLAGGAEAIINGIDGTAYCPSIDIYRDPSDISKNRIHLVWSRVDSGMYSICYSNCTDITSNANFINPNSWCDSTGSPGFDVLSNDIEQGGGVNYGYPSISLDRFGSPHVVWQYEYQSSDFTTNYTVCNKTNGWNNGSSDPIIISPAGGDYRTPCIDVGYNGTIHVAYSDRASSYGINYVQCWNISDSMKKINWGTITHGSGEDIVITNGSGTMREPSLVCDMQGRVWIVTSENVDGDDNIWFEMEDFKDSTYWPGPYLLAKNGDLYNPTIGYDGSNTVYCVWENNTSATNIRIYFSYNSSGSWSTPIEIVAGKKYIYPQIPKNLSTHNNQVSFIYKNNTDFELIFYSIPELPTPGQVIILILFLQLLIMVSAKRKYFKFSKFS